MSLATPPEIDRQLSKLDPEGLKARADDLGCPWNGAGLDVRFYGRLYRVSPAGVDAVDGASPGRTVRGLLLDYVSAGPLAARSAKTRITFRELPGAGPLVTAFANNTHKIIARTFGTDLARLEAACERLKGRRNPAVVGYDLAVEFSALPKVPLHLQFNAAEDEFPAEAGILFGDNAPDFLGPHSLFALATYLTGSLISSV